MLGFRRLIGISASLSWRKVSSWRRFRAKTSRWRNYGVWEGRCRVTARLFRRLESWWCFGPFRDWFLSRYSVLASFCWFLWWSLWKQNCLSFRQAGIEWGRVFLVPSKWCRDEACFRTTWWLTDRILQAVRTFACLHKSSRTLAPSSRKLCCLSWV